LPNAAVQPTSMSSTVGRPVPGALYRPASVPQPAPGAAGFRPARTAPRVSYRASIDWIELEIVTSRPTNFSTIRRRADVAYVQALDRGPGGAATRFKFRVYDLPSWFELDQVIFRILESVELAESPRITGVEIAIDAKTLGNSKADLAQIAADTYKFLYKVADKANHRFVTSPTSGAIAVGDAQDTMANFLAGGTLYIGDHSAAPVCQRIYVKTQDRSIPLHQHQWRARLEITLKGTGLYHRKRR
jgi:hypothetical protein